MDPNLRAVVNLFDHNMNRRKAKRKRQRGARRPPSPPPQRRRPPHRRVKVTALGNATVLHGSIGPATPTWSKLYVPLIFCALGDVPDDLRAALKLPGSQYVSCALEVGRRRTRGIPAQVFVGLVQLEDRDVRGERDEFVHRQAYFSADDVDPVRAVAADDAVEGVVVIGD